MWLMAGSAPACQIMLRHLRANKTKNAYMISHWLDPMIWGTAWFDFMIWGTAEYEWDAACRLHSTILIGSHDLRNCWVWKMRIVAASNKWLPLYEAWSSADWTTSWGLFRAHLGSLMWMVFCDFFFFDIFSKLRRLIQSLPSFLNLDISLNLSIKRRETFDRWASPLLQEKGTQWLMLLQQRHQNRRLIMSGWKIYLLVLATLQLGTKLTPRSFL
jgi:hypothetical protein